MAHNGTAAAAEFQKLLDHRGIVLNYPMFGNATRANSARQDFFVLWKDADPDIPILKEAKAEYSELQ